MAAHAEGQQHPIKIYLQVWILLFVVSGFSYATDFMPDGYFRWFLILAFMFAKAGFIVAIFMHMAWERLALITAILLPPAVLVVLIGLMAVEGGYTFSTRSFFFDPPIAPVGHHQPAEGGH